MRKSQIPILALLALMASFVRALFRYHWVRWVSLPRSLRGPRIFTCRIANAFQVFIGPLWISVPMPWSRVMLDSYARSSPWLLPQKSGIRAALGFCLLLALAVSAHAQPVPATPTSQLAFDHDGVDTSGYELQVDGGAWTPVGVTVQPNGTRVMNLPALTPGPHTLAVRACGPGGCSGPSNTLDVQLVVVPSVPTQLRLVQLADAAPPDGSSVRR